MIAFPDSQPGQSAARVLLTLLFFGATALGPLAWMCFEQPLQAEAEERRLPDWDAESVLEGRYARELEAYLVDGSPVASALRSRFRELEILTGTFERQYFVQRDGGWFFARGAAWSMVEQSPGDSTARRRFIEAIAARIERLKLRCLVVIAPDKERIYPDRFCLSGESLHPTYLARYAALLEEFGGEGFETIDAAAVLHERRRAHPEERVFLRRDGHWSFEGGVAVSRAIGRRLLSQPLGLGQALPVEATRSMRLDTSDHLFELFGLSRGAAASAWIQERQRFISAWFGNDQVALLQRASIGLCGDSFAEAVIELVLPLVAARPVDVECALPGAGPCRGIVELLDRIESGECAATTVVWVFVERAAFVESHWRESDPDGSAGGGR